jgi:hypothetical protein
MVNGLIEVLGEIFGTENVAMVRTGSSSQVNEIGVKISTVNKDGFEYDLCMTLNPQIKDFEDRQTKTKTFSAFDFEESKSEYLRYVEDKKNKEKTKKELKEKKIAKDTARRNKESEENS